MNTREIISKIGALANYKDPEKFWEDIKAQNKEKKWSITPVKIEFKNGQIVENSEDVAKLVALMEEWAKRELEVADLDTLKKDLDITRTIYSWFSGSRKQVTGSFDAVKKSFIEVENRIKAIGEALKKREDDLLEEEYKKREAAILAELKTELNFVKEEYGIELNENLFRAYFKRKRSSKIKRAGFAKTYA